MATISGVDGYGVFRSPGFEPRTCRSQKENDTHWPTNHALLSPYSRQNISEQNMLSTTMTVKKLCKTLKSQEFEVFQQKYIYQIVV